MGVHQFMHGIHIRSFTQLKFGNPFLICGIPIKNKASHIQLFRIRKYHVCRNSLLGRPVLYKNVVVNPVVPMKNGHKACHLCAVFDVIRGVTGLILTVGCHICANAHC